MLIISNLNKKLERVYFLINFGYIEKLMKKFSLDFCYKVVTCKIEEESPI